MRYSAKSKIPAIGDVGGRTLKKVTYTPFAQELLTKTGADTEPCRNCRSLLEAARQRNRLYSYGSGQSSGDSLEVFYLEEVSVGDQ